MLFFQVVNLAGVRFIDLGILFPAPPAGVSLASQMRRRGGGGGQSFCSPLYPAVNPLCR